MGISNQVAVIGTGISKFGEHLDRDYKDLLIDAANEAFRDAGIEPRQVEAGWLGTYMPYAWGFEGNAGTTVSETLNLSPIPVTRVANYCSTGMEAIRNAAFAVASGEVEIALAIGVEKMREVPSRGSLVAQHVEKGHPLYAKGRTAPGMFALLATRYFHEYRVNEESLARVAVKNHKNGALNPKAHFQKEITLEQAMKAPPVAEPLRLFDCCPTTDGAAACILTRADLARSWKKEHVLLKGVGLATWGGYFTMQFHPEFDFLGFKSTQEAAKKAYAQAGVKNPAKEIHMAEVHDCFTITELLNYEDLGFCARGEGWKLIRDGVTALDGALPVNPSGGLKSFGHPVGASGVRMVNEVSDQIRGRSGKRQVKGARMGVAHTLGGPGVVACVMVLGAP